ncbi:MAG TPA: amino acid adenylation domain-containing protein, partial [Thermoanaerobaculia bacterium]|nr:amino acid adenylation domain-containing protein [Thermoanaerobaculia bacterium]
TVLELSTDRPRPAAVSFRGFRQAVQVPPALIDGLKALARREDTTLFAALVAAYGVLLRCWSGQDDVLMGTPIADRNRPETEVLIGYFLNMLILRADLTGGPTFRQALGRARDMVQGAYAHQDLPFGKLLDELRLQRNLNRSPLFQVAFVYVKIPEVPSSPETAQPETSQLSLTGIPLDPGTTRVDMTLVFEELPQGATCFFEYSRDIFDPPSLARMAAHFERLLAQGVDHPERPVADLALLSEAERWAVLGEWNDTAAPGGSWVIGLFEEQVRQLPDAAALVFEDHALTYAELNRRSNRLAHDLRRLGVGPDRLVGLGMERSPDLVTGCLAVLKAGGAYLPLDPTYPRARLEKMLEDAGAAVVLTGEETLTGGGDANPGVEPAPEHLAYVLFTSGSTGRPKGVEIPHRALINFLRSARSTLGFAAGQRLLAVTSLSFDLSVLEIFLPLTAGGCVELLRRDDVVDGAWLAARIAESAPDVIQATPATWLMLVEAGWRGTGTQAISSAEALSRSLGEAVAARAGELWNFYGPTETTVWSTGQRVERGGTGPVPVGRPLGNTSIRTLDRDLRLTSVSVPGEVYIGGASVARGYRGRPDLTAERFVPDPLGPPGGRLYRTGDLARRRPDGALELLGRIDHQLKVRGYRIEPGEVEAVLSRHAAVRETVVLAREEQGGQWRLTACVVPQPEAVPPSAGELRSWLSRDLPDYMVPSSFVVLPAIPRLPNGKVDRQALLRSAPAGLPGTDAGRAAPRTPAEEVLAALWSSLLETADFGVHDNFFEAGGHSLLGMRLMTRVREVFGVELPLRALFEAPTLGGLAARIDAAQGQPGRGEVSPPGSLPRPAEIPLSFAQERLWFLDRLTPGAVAYNIRSPMRLRGPLAHVLLESCFAEVIRRHESLRTRFDERGGEPVQIVDPPCRWSMPEVDLTALPEALRRPEAERR